MASWSTQAWHSVTSSVLSVGNVRSCNHTAAVKNLFQSWRKVWKPFLTGTMSSSLATSFSFKVGCKLRSMNFPRVTWEFSGDKKGLRWIHAFVVHCRVCIPIFVLQFLWPIFCDPVYVFSFLRFSEIRIYVSTTYRVRVVYICNLGPRVLRVNSPVSLSSLSQTLLCSSTVHWPQE